MNAITPALPALNVKTFMFDGCPIRVIEQNGEARFVAVDACAAINLKDVSDAVAKLDEDEKGRASIPTPGGMQDMLVVTEAGLYTIILRSRGAMTAGTAPHRFRRYVTAEVLPAIRKTGSYSIAPQPQAVSLLEALRDPNQVLALIAHHAQATLAARAELSAEQDAHSETHAYLEDQVRLTQIESSRAETSGRALVVATRTIEVQQPIVERHRRLVETDGAMSVTEAANVVGVSRDDLYRFLRDRDHREPWIYLRPGSTEERPFKGRCRRKELRVRLVEITRTSGKTERKPQTLITPKGLDLILQAYPGWAVEQARKASQAAGRTPDLFDEGG